MPELPRARQKCVWGRIPNRMRPRSFEQRAKLRQVLSPDDGCYQRKNSSKCIDKSKYKFKYIICTKSWAELSGDDGYKTIIQGKSQGSCTVHNVHKAFLYTKYIENTKAGLFVYLLRVWLKQVSKSGNDGDQRKTSNIRPMGLLSVKHRLALKRL